MISQHVTFYKNYKQKTYTEKVDGTIMVKIHYDKYGNVIYLWYSSTEWERWGYYMDGKRCSIAKYSCNRDGNKIQRTFDLTGRMTYEKYNNQVTYDRSLNK
jgi:hypothetical protein